MCSSIYSACVAIFGGVQVDTFCRCIAEISAYSDSPRTKVDVLPLKGTALAPPDAGVNQKMNQRLPFQRLMFQAGDNLLNLCRSVGQRTVCLDFILSRFGALHLVHGITGDHVSQVGHFEETVEDGVNLDDGRVGLAIGLDVQQQSRKLGRGDFREFDVTQGRIDLLTVLNKGIKG